MSQNSISAPLRPSRIWLDFGKLVLAAAVQGVVVSAVVALVVMILASGAVAEPAGAPASIGVPGAATPEPSSAAVPRPR